MDLNNASVIEILWTVLGLCALLASLDGLRVSLGDRAALRCVPSYRVGGPRDILAKQAIRNDMVRALTQAAFVCMGFLAMATPPSQPSNHFSWVGLIFGLLLIACEVLLALDAIGDRFQRRQIDRLLARQALERALRSDGERSEL